MSKSNPVQESAYEALNVIHRSFEEILQRLERLQKLEEFRNQEPIKAVTLAVRETRAWTLFEILEILHARVENEWTRLGHLRSGPKRSRGKPRRPFSD